MLKTELMIVSFKYVLFPVYFPLFCLSKTQPYPACLSQKSRVRFDTSYLMPHIQLITKSRLVLLGNIYCESIPQPPSPPLPPSLRPHLSAGIQSPNWSVSMENAKYIQQRRRVVGGTPMYSSPPTTITTNIRLSLFHQYSSCAPPAPHPLHYFEINLCIRVTCDHVQGCQLKQMLIHTL